MLRLSKLAVTWVSTAKQGDVEQRQRERAHSDKGPNNAIHRGATIAHRDELQMRWFRTRSCAAPHRSSTQAVSAERAQVVIQEPKATKRATNNEEARPVLPHRPGPVPDEAGEVHQHGKPSRAGRIAFLKHRPRL